MRYCPLCERTYGDDVTVCAVDGSILRDSGTQQDPLIGKMVRARYRVLKKLGEGGMGSVYLAEQIAINRNVALKILHPDYARDSEFVKRFRQEAKLAASLSHHNIVTIFDFDQADDGSLYIVMEYVAGESLSAVIKGGLLDIGRAIRLGIQIAEGLRAAHAAGVIHRDIKPENIMVLPGDEIKLMDFGIARLSNVEGATRLTRSGMIVGTPTYMAPEQIEGGEVGEATDIYAFGVLLYEMLSGQVPFSAPTPGAILVKHLTDIAPPLRKLRNDVPASLDKIVKQALEKKPDRRQRSMNEVVELLTGAQRASAADRKSILSTMGGLFKSAFTRALETKRPTHGRPVRQEQGIEPSLEGGSEETRLSPEQPSAPPEPASPTIERPTDAYPVAGAPTGATAAFEEAPVPVAATGETETIGLTRTEPPSPRTEVEIRYAAPSNTVADAPSAESETIGLTRPSEIRTPDGGVSPLGAASTVIDAPSGETLAETIATTATAPVRRRKAATGLYTGLGVAAVVLLTALGFFLYYGQSNEPETARLAQSATEAPTPAVTNEPTGQRLPAKVESSPRETAEDFQIKPEHLKTNKSPQPPRRETKHVLSLPAPPSPPRVTETKIKSTKVPEVKPTPAKEHAKIAKPAPAPKPPPGPPRVTETKIKSAKVPEVKPTLAKEHIKIAKLAPAPKAPPVKKVIQEQVKVPATPKEPDSNEIIKPAPVMRAPATVKKESETKVASIDRTTTKQAEAPVVPLENRLVSLAIISAKKDIKVNERVLLTVKGKYSDGKENEIVAGVRFQTSDASVAAVNSRGEVEGKKEGKVEVTARYAGVVSGAYTFHVKGSPEKPKEKPAGERLQDERRRLLR